MTEAHRDTLEKQRKALPAEPGVYIFRAENGEVIYVGKAKSVRKRVSDHFKGRATERAKEMISLVDQIDFVVTATEAEALLTEDSFIKRYRPRFNIRMRDDKSYPYIAVSLDEEYPRVYFTRERHRPGRAYFGPFTSSRRVRGTLDLLAKVFHYRSCEGKVPGRASGSPCLDYYIKRCQAPCVDKVSQQEYRASIEMIIGFLRGNYRQIETELAGKMKKASREQRFEQAAAYRDRLKAVRELFQKERVARQVSGSADFIAVALEGYDANAQVFQVRDGILAGRNSFYLANEAGSKEAEVVEQFAAQYYSTAVAMPKQVVVPTTLSDCGTLQRALSALKGGKVEVGHAQRGNKKRIMELAQKNAHLALAQERLKREHSHQRRIEAIDGLAQALGMEAIPIRMECFDISNLGASQTVASMVVFEEGMPKKSDYRRFQIRGLSGQDDYAAIEQVLSRRLARYLAEQDLSPHEKERDTSFAALPDLVVIDGGKGQLGRGLEALKDFRKRGVNVVSLAKRQEEVFLPGRRGPLLLPPASAELQLLQRLRDEAHRFALAYHRKRRGKSVERSLLDELPGVGPARKRLLLKHFGSPERLLQAGREELEAVPGLPAKLARELYGHLHKAG